MCASINTLLQANERMPEAVKEREEYKLQEETKKKNEKMFDKSVLSDLLIDLR